jgi:hypothetical protein
MDGRVEGWMDGQVDEREMGERNDRNELLKVEDT